MGFKSRHHLTGSCRTLVPLPMVVALFIQACATTAPSPEQIHYYRRYGNLLQDKPSSLILDGCVIRDEVGEDYVLLQATEEVSNAAMDTAVRALEANEYEVSESVIPFSCGVLSPDGDGGTVMFDAASRKGEEREEMTFPIVQLEQSTEDDRRLANVYHAMLQQVMAAEPSASKHSHARRGEEAPLALDSAQIDLLKEAFGTDFVWIIRVGGVQVSAGKTLGTGILTGLMSAAISGGTLIYTQSAVPGNGYDIALVNLGNNTLIWKKNSLVQHGNPASPGIYNGDWAKEAFSPFMHLTPPPPVTQVPEMNAEEILSAQSASLLRAEAQALYAHQVSDRTILDAAAQRIWDERHAEDDMMVDAMAWFCRVLGQSGDGRYKSLLDDVAEEAATRKLRRFAESGSDEVPGENAEQFQPE